MTALRSYFVLFYVASHSLFLLFMGNLLSAQGLLGSGMDILGVIIRRTLDWTGIKGFLEDILRLLGIGKGNEEVGPLR